MHIESSNKSWRVNTHLQPDVAAVAVEQSAKARRCPPRVAVQQQPAEAVAAAAADPTAAWRHAAAHSASAAGQLGAAKTVADQAPVTDMEALSGVANLVARLAGHHLVTAAAAVAETGHPGGCLTGSAPTAHAGHLPTGLAVDAQIRSGHTSLHAAVDAAAECYCGHRLTGSAVVDVAAAAVVVTISSGQQPSGLGLSVLP